MINEFKDFKLLINLGFELEEIAAISFTDEERKYAYYKEFINDFSNTLNNQDKENNK